MAETVAEIRERHEHPKGGMLPGPRHLRCWEAIGTLLAEVERLDASRKRAEAVCDAWGHLEPMSNCSALRGKQLLAMQQAYNAWRAGKGD